MQTASAVKPTRTEWYELLDEAPALAAPTQAELNAQAHVMQPHTLILRQSWYTVSVETGPRPHVVSSCAEFHNGGFCEHAHCP